MRLVRDNDDPKIQHDLDLLARAFGDAEGGNDDESPLEAGVPGDDLDDHDGHVDDEGEVDPISLIEDPVVRTMVRGSVHVRRFLPYYLGAAAWVLVMLLISPRTDQPAGVDDGGFAFADDAAASAPAAGETAESAFAEAPAPSFSDIGATPADSGFGFSSTPAAGGDFAAGGFDDSAPSEGFDSGQFEGGSGDFSSGAGGGFGSSDIAAEPEPLRITKSGYSSATGGTPLEQAPPGNGLPVGTLPGQPTKRGFVAVSGDESMLRLKPVEDPSNLNADQAQIRACVIVLDDWKAERGSSFENEPLWQEPCVDGVRSADGIWSFDLSKLGKPAQLPGFAITPATASPAFNLTFEPSAVTSG